MGRAAFLAVLLLVAASAAMDIGAVDAERATKVPSLLLRDVGSDVAGVDDKAILPVSKSHLRHSLMPRRSDVDSMASMREAYEKIPAKMKILGAAEIKDAVESAAEQAGLDSSVLARLVLMASGYGDIQALLPVMEEVRSRQWVLWASLQEGSLGDVLTYLAGKVEAFSEPFKESHTFRAAFGAYAKDIMSKRFTNRRPVIMMDDVLLRRMTTDEKLAKELVESVDAFGDELILVAPLGYTGGLNMFVQMDYVEVINDLAERLARRRDLVEALEDGQLEQALSEVLEEPVTTALGKVFMSFDKQAPRVEFIRPRRLLSQPEDMPVFERIAALLRPKLPSIGHWLGMLDGLDECHAADVIGKTLDKEARLLSMTNLAEYSRKLKRDLDDPETGFAFDYIYLPIEGRSAKSYHMAILSYMMANPTVDPSIVRVQSFFTMSGRRDLKVLVLDDYAGSGSSLIETCGTIKSMRYKVAAAPFLMSIAATQALQKEGLPAYAGDWVGKFDESGLDPTVRMGWMGATGFANMVQFIAMPYMAPDNNCVFAANRLAPLFVLDVKGVKPNAGFQPICTDREIVKTSIEESAFNDMFSQAVESAMDDGASPDGVAFVVQFCCRPETNPGMKDLESTNEVLGPSVAKSAILAAAEPDGVPWRTDLIGAKPSPESVSRSVDLLVEKNALLSSGAEVGFATAELADEICVGLYGFDTYVPEIGRFLLGNLKFAPFFGIDVERMRDGDGTANDESLPG